MRAGAAIRNVGHAFVGREMTLEQIDRLSTVLEGLADELWPGGRRTRTVIDLPFPAEGIPQGRIAPDYSDRPISGGASPWGLDVELHRDGDEIVATAMLRSAHEGAPDRAHGGIVAALFDDVMGFVLGMLAQPAFTGELCVRYTGATPLFVPLECRCRTSGREGRKIFMTGELLDPSSGEICATATSTFIAVDGYRVHTAQRPAPDDTTGPTAE